LPPAQRAAPKRVFRNGDSAALPADRRKHSRNINKTVIVLS
jgi:hypothetical protein